ncbi:MAG: ABC transporter substrate-binding protein [Arcobacteraceae bacterium]
MFKIILFILLFFASVYFTLKDEVYRDKEIIFSSSLPKTGIMNQWGKSVESGILAYFNYINDNNLLHNKTIKFIAYDDKYEPALTLENIEKLIKEHNTFGFLGFVGTPTVKNILPILEENPMPFIAPFTGAEFLRQKHLENIINIRSSYKDEIEKLVDYLYHKKNLSKFAVFYQNDDYGEEGYISLIKALDKRNLPLIAEGTYKRNTLSLSHAFDEIKEVKPEVIVLVGAYKANALFIQKAKQHPNFKNTIFCVISFGDANAVVKELAYQTDNIIFSQVVPSYDDVSIPVINEYKLLMNRYYPNEPLGFISLESFLAAKTVVKTIQSINGHLSNETFLKAIKGLPHNFLEGVPTEFKDNQLLNDVHLFEYKESKFVEIAHEH